MLQGKVVYYVSDNGIGFIIEFPISVITRIAIHPLLNKPTTSQQGLETPLYAQVIIELAEKPLFLMEVPSHGRWRQCTDFSEHQQVSQILTHFLIGPLDSLQQQFLNIADSSPLVAYVLCFEKPLIADSNEEIEGVPRTATPSTILTYPSITYSGSTQNSYAAHFPDTPATTFTASQADTDSNTSHAAPPPQDSLLITAETPGVDQTNQRLSPNLGNARPESQIFQRPESQIFQRSHRRTRSRSVPTGIVVQDFNITAPPLATQASPNIVDFPATPLPHVFHPFTLQSFSAAATVPDPVQCGVVDFSQSGANSTTSGKGLGLQISTDTQPSQQQVNQAGLQYAPAWAQAQSAGPTSATALTTPISYAESAGDISAFSTPVYPMSTSLYVLENSAINPGMQMNVANTDYPLSELQWDAINLTDHPPASAETHGTPEYEPTANTMDQSTDNVD